MKTLRPYQEEASTLATGKNLLIADDRGLGKTVTSIETALAVMHRLQGPALVIVPKTLKPQWAEEIADQDNNATIMFLDATTTLDKPFTSRKPFWVLTHYEALLKHHKMLANTFWAVVVADEAHRIKNRKAQRSVAIKKLQAYRKLALTGTPYDRNPADIWSILNWLYPTVFKSYWKFFETHVDWEGDIAGAKTIHGVKDGAKFSRVIAPYIVQRSKRDVAPMLPPKIEMHVPIELTPKQGQLYTRIKHLAETDLKLDTPLNGADVLLVKNHLGRILRLQQAAVDPMLLGTDDAGGKIAWLLEYVDDNPDDTLLVFTRFRDTAIRVANILGVPYFVGGKTNIPDGSTFADHPKIVATIDAAKEGLNLGHIWHTVFLDCHWSSIAMAQAVDRTERDLAATEPRRITYLEAVDYAGNATVDALVRQALEGKWETIALVNAWLKSVKDNPASVAGGSVVPDYL